MNMFVHDVLCKYAPGFKSVPVLPALFHVLTTWDRAAGFQVPKAQGTLW